MNVRSCPAPQRRKNELGIVLRRLRLAAGLSQAKLVAVLQRAGWDLDRAVWVRVEAGKRTLLDYEVAFVLRALGITWGDLAREVMQDFSTEERTPPKIRRELRR